MLPAVKPWSRDTLVPRKGSRNVTIYWLEW